MEDKYFKLKSPEITKRIKNLLFPSYIIGYEQYQNLITNGEIIEWLLIVYITLTLPFKYIILF